MAVREQPLHLSRCPNFRNRLKQLDIGESQRAVAAAAFAVSAIELVQLTGRTDDGIDWMKR
jgi:hypothetical protein